jgi:hypothetical protein
MGMCHNYMPVQCAGGNFSMSKGVLQTSLEDNGDGYYEDIRGEV